MHVFIYFERVLKSNKLFFKNNKSISVSYTKGLYRADKDHVGNLQNPKLPVTSEISLVTKSHSKNPYRYSDKGNAPTNKPLRATRVKAGSDETSAF
jgi:hypothetical protein